MVSLHLKYLLKKPETNKQTKNKINIFPPTNIHTYIVVWGSQKYFPEFTNLFETMNNKILIIYMMLSTITICFTQLLHLGETSSAVVLTTSPMHSLPPWTWTDNSANGK